jgi:hypothetical protein
MASVARDQHAGRAQPVTIGRMRAAWLCLLLAGCDAGAADPPADSPAEPPAKPQDCPRACTADDSDCSGFPYEQLPARCADICYLGACCDLVDGRWITMIYDCARPRADAGIDSTM